MIIDHGWCVEYRPYPGQERDTSGIKILEEKLKECEKENADDTD